MSQRILNFDSQTLNAIQKCAYFTDLHYNSRWQPLKKGESLEKGSLMHAMLDPYYSLVGQCVRPGAEWIEPSITAGLLKSEFMTDMPTSWADIVRYCRDLGYYLAIKQDLDTDVSDSVIYQFTEYCKNYENDAWHPLAVEEVGSKVLFENEHLKIIYSFKVDLIAEKGTILCPWDHKTASQRKEPTSVSNQFIGYCWGLDVNNIIINKIGFQKTLSPKERFQRFTLTISPLRIKEWIQNTTYWALYYMECLDSNVWPMNLTSCDKYSGCIFLRTICEANPENRLYTLERDFKIGESWDVANFLEGE